MTALALGTGIEFDRCAAIRAITLKQAIFVECFSSACPQKLAVLREFAAFAGTGNHATIHT